MWQCIHRVTLFIIAVISSNNTFAHLFSINCAAVLLPCYGVFIGETAGSTHHTCRGTATPHNVHRTSYVLANRHGTHAFGRQTSQMGGHRCVVNTLAIHVVDELQFEAHFSENSRVVAGVGGWRLSTEHSHRARSSTSGRADPLKRPTQTGTGRLTMWWRRYSVIPGVIQMSASRHLQSTPSALVHLADSPCCTASARGKSRRVPLVVPHR